MKDYLAQFQAQEFPSDTSSGQLTELPKPPFVGSVSSSLSGLEDSRAPGGAITSRSTSARDLRALLQWRVEGMRKGLPAPGLAIPLLLATERQEAKPEQCHSCTEALIEGSDQGRVICDPCSQAKLLVLGLEAKTDF